MTTEPSLGATLATAQALYKDAAFEDLVELVTDRWDVLGRLQPSRDAADLCRLTMLAHYRLGADGAVPEHYLWGYLWRARALIRAAASGWISGVVALVQTEALRIQVTENQNVTASSPGYRVISQAHDILSEMEPYADASDPGEAALQPSPRVVGRLLYEKRAFLRFLSGDYADALADYDKALTFTKGDERAELKVLGGKANALFAAGDAAQRESALKLLEVVERRARTGGHREIASIAAQNIERFGAAHEELVPYEAL